MLTSFWPITNLSSLIGLFICLFTVLTAVYSYGFMRGQKNIGFYYLYIFATALVSLKIAYTDNLLTLLIYWGFLSVLLYLLIGFGKTDKTSVTAKKTLIISAGSDVFMILGIALIWSHTQNFVFLNSLISLTQPWAIIAYLCLLVAGLAKAGAMPLHSWIPDAAENAPIPVTAFLPASLDKLLGIYLILRLNQNIFIPTPEINILLMSIGAITIIAAVMMALIQHNFKRLLGYHAVSQVGYMILGIGTGTAVGIAGGVFHMINHTIYKAGLFLTGGSVEKQTNTADLDKLGGLAKPMPITFISFLICALAISGIPPLNGFVSKWMIYQGILDSAKQSHGLWILWLIAAMFGSALTLASFMKLLNAVFLGQPQNSDHYQEVSPIMFIPGLFLAALCVIFGVWAYPIINSFIAPGLTQTINISGTWSSQIASLLILLGLFFGIVFYLLGKPKNIRQTPNFVGGEDLTKFADMRVSGTDFYKTITDIKWIGAIYKAAENKWFDLYDLGKNLVNWIYQRLKYLHNGILLTYISWCLLGLLIILTFLFKS